MYVYYDSTGKLITSFKTPPYRTEIRLCLLITLFLTFSVFTYKFLALKKESAEFMIAVQLHKMLSNQDGLSDCIISVYSETLSYPGREGEREWQAVRLYFFLTSRD